MDPEAYSEFAHEAIHALQRSNDECAREFRVTTWPRWDYDLERGTLTFSHEGVPKVVASIVVVGSTSEAEGTWLWSWANAGMPPGVTQALAKVKDFGSTESISELTRESLPDNEFLGWRLTAVTAKLLGSLGGYRCPVEDGFVYVVYSSLRWITNSETPALQEERLACGTHGNGFKTYVCEHLIANPAQQWFSGDPTEENPWPDAWCAICNVHFLEQGEWNDKNESKIKAKLLCHFCYQLNREKSLSPRP